MEPDENALTSTEPYADDLAHLSLIERRALKLYVEGTARTTREASLMVGARSDILASALSDEGTMIFLRAAMLAEGITFQKIAEVVKDGMEAERAVVVSQGGENGSEIEYVKDHGERRKYTEIAARILGVEIAKPSNKKASAPSQGATGPIEDHAAKTRRLGATLALLTNEQGQSIKVEIKPLGEQHDRTE
jgi:hypothetical protein